MSINYDISANIIYQLQHLKYGQLVYKIVVSVFQIRKVVKHSKLKNKQSANDLKSVTDFLV